MPLEDLTNVVLEGQQIGAYMEPTYRVEGLNEPVSLRELIEYILDNLGSGGSGGTDNVVNLQPSTRPNFRTPRTETAVAIGRKNKREGRRMVGSTCKSRKLTALQARTKNYPAAVLKGDFSSLQHLTACTSTNRSCWSKPLPAITASHATRTDYIYNT